MSIVGDVRLKEESVNNKLQLFSMTHYWYWRFKGAFHLSELTGQSIPVVKRISLLIKTIQPDQSKPKTPISFSNLLV